MLRSSMLALVLVTSAAASCSDLPDVIQPPAGGSAAGAGAAGNAGGGGKAGGGRGGQGDDNLDAGADEDASS